MNATIPGGDSGEERARVSVLIETIKHEFSELGDLEARTSAALYRALDTLYVTAHRIDQNPDEKHDVMFEIRKRQDVGAKKSLQTTTPGAQLLLTMVLGTKTNKPRKSKYRAVLEEAALAGVLAKPSALSDWLESRGGLEGVMALRRKRKHTNRARPDISRHLEMLPAVSEQAPVIEYAVPPEVTLPNGYGVLIVVEEVSDSGGSSETRILRPVELVADPQVIRSVASFANRHRSMTPEGLQQFREDRELIQGWSGRGRKKVAMSVQEAEPQEEAEPEDVDRFRAEASEEELAA